MTDTIHASRRAGSLGPRDAARARGQPALPVRRDSEALFLTQSYVYASAEQAEERFKSEARLHLQPLRQPDGRHVRGAHAAAGRRARPRAPPPPAWRPSPPRCCASSRPATTSSRRAPCSARAATWCEDLCPRFGIASTLVDGRDTRRLAARHAPQHQGVVLRDAGQPDARPRRHRRRLARSRTRPARWSSSTTCSPRRCCRSR